MATLLAAHAVQAIRTEVSKPHLEAQGCSERGFLERLREHFVVPIIRGRAWAYDVTGVWARRGPVALSVALRADDLLS